MAAIFFFYPIISKYENIAKNALLLYHQDDQLFKNERG
jgi:hypothetical protein